MTELNVLISSSALDDAGTRTADLYDWQAAMAAADGLALLARHLEPHGGLGIAQGASVICEHHEDWIVKSGAAVTVALRRRDTHYPPFLLIDSPRTSPNNDDELASALYRRLVAMADDSQDEIQLVIGDNELPAEYRRDYEQLNFDYDHPTIRTVRHPGREAVKTLSDGAGQPE